MIERVVLLADKPSLSAADLEPFLAAGEAVEEVQVQLASNRPQTEPMMMPMAMRPYAPAGSHSPLLGS